MGNGSINRRQAETKLKEAFGISSFHDDQWKAIERLLNRKRVLMVEKTGFGKSLCYQFPAIEFEHMTVVFSPLLSLMRDQINKLNQLGIPAAAINSEQEIEENEQIIENAKMGQYKLLYIAPERQENEAWIQAVRDMKISMVVIDEAHCISTWGHDFRPAFRRIIDLVKILPQNVPVIATTATATDRVVDDIIAQIPGDIEYIRGDLMRENFYLNVMHVSEQDAKLSCLEEIVNKQEGFGIIYTGTRSDTEKYAKYLQFRGVSCVPYHAGNDKEIRKQKEQGMMLNKWKCMTATNALGMGIDKQDISFIVHTQMPSSPIHYYQEIGRAGRDGRPVNIYLIYNEEDIELPMHFINNARPDIDTYNRVIDALKRQPSGEQDIMRATGLIQTPVRVIVNDLLDQNIIIKTEERRRKIYEYRYGAPEINYGLFEEYRQYKIQQLDKMIEYINSPKCRMRYLCEYLGDKTSVKCNKCDRCTDNELSYDYTEDKQIQVKQFNEGFHPAIELETASDKEKPLSERRSKLTDGVAFSYYGKSKVGKIVHKCKYENGGDFPQLIINGICDTFSSYYKNEKFDIIIYVPPTESGNLVRNLAVKVGDILNIPVYHGLKKFRETKPQKDFENSILKRDNLKDAFYIEDVDIIVGKKVLLIDDVCDSKVTIREIGRLLSKMGVEQVSPIVIAKTVGGEEV